MTFRTCSVSLAQRRRYRCNCSEVTLIVDIAVRLSDYYQASFRRVRRRSLRLVKFPKNDTKVRQNFRRLRYTIPFTIVFFKINESHAYAMTKVPKKG